jgi:hypothetical protein
MDLLDIIGALVESEGIFYSNIRYFSNASRSSLIQQHQANVSATLAILRIVVSQTQGIVINIPIEEPMHPTANQILAATSVVTPEAETECAICQEIVERATRINRCNHHFHDACIRAWFTRSSSCPVCRADITGR